MPRAGPSQGRRVDRDDDDADYSIMTQASQAQTQSLTQAQRAAENLPQEVIDRKVSDFVQYMLIMESKKAPVKRADIYKNVLKEHKAILQEVIRRATIKLREIFGFDLVEVEHSTGKTKTKVYFLLNGLKPELTQDLVEDSDQVKMGLLFTVLALIFMSEGSVGDSQMWHFLEKLGVNAEDKDHPVYGDVKKLLTQEYTKQLYLDYVKVPNTDPVVHDFKWGLRAEKEMDKEQILNLVAKIHGPHVDPRMWKTQYREVLISKGLNPDADAQNREENDYDEDEDEDDENEDDSMDVD